MKPKQTVESFNPAQASKALATQQKNRSVTKAHVAWLSAQMARGEWRLAQPIIFDENDCLIDGQHRLLSVVESGKTIEFHVIRGMDPDSWAVLDTGRIRKGADVLSAEGRSFAPLLAATLRLVWQDELGVLGSSKPEHRPSNEDILDRDREHPEIGRDVVRAVNVGPYARYAAIAFLYWRTFRANKDVAAAFWPGVLTGERLLKKTPPYLLYQLLVQQRTGSRRLNGIELLAYAIKAWNYTLVGSCPAALRWARGAEDFPRINATRPEALVDLREALRAQKDHKARAAREAVAAS